MTANPFALCGACGRATLATGPLFTVEAAWDNTSTNPAAVELWALYADPLLLNGLATLNDRLVRYCAKGKLPVPEELNHLRDELWEFKGGTIRLAFYEVGEACGRRTLRATHPFVKGTEKTPRREIDRGLAIARIDAKIP